MARALLLVAALTGCDRARGPEAPPTPEQQIARDLAAQVGVPVDRVRCPDGPYPKTCVAEVEGSAGLELAVADDGAELSWSVAGFVISTAPLEIQIGIELDDLGVEAEVDCGDRFRVTNVGQVIECALTIGDDRGAAWVKIVDDEARFELEVALDAAAVAARTAEVDDAELLRRSRELDDGVNYDALDVSSTP